MICRAIWASATGSSWTIMMASPPRVSVMIASWAHFFTPSPDRGSLVDVVHDLPRHLGQRHRIVMDDHDGVPASGLRDDRLLGPLLHPVFERLANGSIHARAHEGAEPVDVGLQDTPPFGPEGVVRALRLPPVPAIAHDVH